MTLLIIGFAAGVIVGLLLGPDSEREFVSHVEGWIEGYRYASRDTRRMAATPESGSVRSTGGAVPNEVSGDAQ